MKEKRLDRTTETLVAPMAAAARARQPRLVQQTLSRVHPVCLSTTSSTKTAKSTMMATTLMAIQLQMAVATSKPPSKEPSGVVMAPPHVQKPRLVDSETSGDVFQAAARAVDAARASEVLLVLTVLH